MIRLVIISGLLLTGLLVAVFRGDNEGGQASGHGGPGQLLSLDAHAVLSPEEVNAEVAGRFQNDGESAPAAVTGVEVHVLSFSTTGPDGGSVAGVAQLYIPAEPAERALLAFAPGSTGMARTCGPLQLLRETGFGGTYGATALAYAGQGLATVLPDYLGTLGEDGLQPYFVATAEAAVLIDALRAARIALDFLDSDVEVDTNFLAGYSQGGHAVMAAADRLATYAPDLPVGGVIGFGLSGDVEVLFRHFQYTAPWVVWSYMNTYPNAGLDAADVLAPEYAATLERDVRSLCVAEAQTNYPTATSVLYTPEFDAALQGGTLARDFPAWAEAFTANATGVREHGIPVIVLQGVDDPVVPFDDQTEYVRRLCELGTAVRYVNYVRTRHETRYIGFEETLAWMRERSAGVEAPSDCGQVLQ